MSDHEEVDGRLALHPEITRPLGLLLHKGRMDAIGWPRSAFRIVLEHRIEAGIVGVPLVSVLKPGVRLPSREIDLDVEAIDRSECKAEVLNLIIGLR
jgi:hypothetical protein